MTVLRRLLRVVQKAVGWITVVLFSWMVVIALVQLVFRWFKLSGIEWADQQLRQLVLWLALLGGVLAAAEARHIKIDLLGNLFEFKAGDIIRRIVSACAGIGTIYLTLVSFEFLASEMHSGSKINGMLFGLTVSTWVVEAIIPVGFGLMSLYFFGLAVLTEESAPAQGSQ